MLPAQIELDDAPLTVARLRHDTLGEGLHFVWAMQEKHGIGVVLEVSGLTQRREPWRPVAFGWSAQRRQAQHRDAESQRDLLQPLTDRFHLMASLADLRVGLDQLEV